MADVNANIGVHIDTSAALAELKALQRQLANFHSSVAKNSAAAAQAQKGLQTNLLNSINATGKFHAQMGVVRSSTDSFTHALEKNKLSMREYFRYAGGSTRTFGKLFKSEFNTIGKVAEERVKKMQTQYIKMGRDASGAIKSMSITPRTLDMTNYATKTAVAAQKQAIFNQLLKQGSTNLLNFGKNTQWSGRQLMVGFTVPLMYFGGAAAKVFMDLEKQAIRFKRVYGDMFTTSDETNKALKEVELLAEGFTKYGVAVAKTMEMAANAAAMGKTGADLAAQVSEATRLAILGNVEQEQALETTISVTNAFGVAAEDLAGKINFLNAVENQTVVSIEDLTIAIPKAGPVVKQLGGSVEDLAFFLTAMKEGGINASEGANALKSGLASLINPTKKASDMLAGFGVNIKSIVEGNKGNIRQTVIDFSRALDTIDPLNRARAIEQLFGKFQFSRLSTLFQNVTKDGTQASRVLDLATASIEELAIISERELGVLEDAIGTDFKESIEKLKLAIAPIGGEFLKAITPVAKAIGSFLEKFNNLGDGTKKFIVVATTLVGVIGPVLLMTFGLLANGVANIIKLFITMRSGFLRAGANTQLLAQQTSYLNTEQLEAATVAASLNQVHTRLTQSFNMEATAVRLLRQAYLDATLAARNFAMANPGMMMPGGKFKPGPTPKKFASGVDTVPGTGSKDTVPAMLTPGEAVIPKRVAQDPRFAPIIDAIVNGNLQGFNGGSTRVAKVTGNNSFSFDGVNYPVKSKVDDIVNKINAAIAKDPDQAQRISRRAKDLVNPNGEGSNRKGEQPKNITATTLQVTASRKNKTKVRTGSDVNPEISKARRLLGYSDPITGKPVKGIKEDFTRLYSELRKEGLSPNEAKNFIGNNESHIKKSLNTDNKWFEGHVARDVKGLNNYLNRLDPSRVKPGATFSFEKLLLAVEKDKSHLPGITKEQIKALKADLEFVKSGRHPVNAAELQRILNLANFDEKISTNKKLMKELNIPKDYAKKSYQAKGVKVLGKLRKQSGYSFYKALDILSLGGNINNPFAIRESISLGERINKSSGRGATVRGIDGEYEINNKKVFVKGFEKLENAKAEMKANALARNLHGLVSPEGMIRMIQDPNNSGRQIPALINDFDSSFTEENMKKQKFNADDMAKQLVASALRGDKDVKTSNMSGRYVVDPGSAYIYDTSSGVRKPSTQMSSMEEMIEKNLRIVDRQGASKDFSNSVGSLVGSMTAEEFDTKIRKEINNLLDKADKALIDSGYSKIEAAKIKARLQGGLNVDYKNIHNRYIASRSVAVKPSEVLEDKDGTRPINTIKKPKGIKTASPEDTRLAPIGVAPAVRNVPKISGGYKGVPRVVGLSNAPLIQSGVPMSALPSGLFVPASQIQNLTQSVQNNTDANEGNTKASEDSTKTNKDTKKDARAQRAQRVGMVAGPLAGAAGIAAMGGYMTGNTGIGNVAMGVAGIASLAPMFAAAGPVGKIAGAALLVGGGLYFLNKHLEQSAKKQAEFVKETSGTTQKMTEVGKITGAVGASQIMERKRKSGSFGAYNDAQRAGSMFGDTFLQSDIGKTMVKGFVENMEKFGSKQAASDFALQLSTYVSDGVLTAEQAEGIAEQIGIQLGNQRYGIEIKGNVRSIIGPNGEDLAKDPLRIRTQIITQAIKRTDRELTRLSEAESGSTTGRNETARIAAIGANNLEIIQAQADATNLMYQKQIDLLDKQLETTASLEKQLQIKEQISVLEANQAADVSQINTMLSNRLQKEVQIFKTRIQTKDQVGPDLIYNDANMREDAYFDSLKSIVKDTYKGTDYETLASDALKRLSELSDLTKRPLDRGRTKSGFGSAEKAQELEVQMSLLMKSKILNPEQSNALLNLFAGKLPELQQVLDLGIRTQGSEKTVAMLDFFTGLDLDKEKAVKISTQIIKSDPTTFDQIGEALASLSVLDDHEVNMSAYIETVGYDGLVALANKLSVVEKLPKTLSKKIIIQSLKDGALDGTGLDQASLELLMSQWKDFDALPDSVQKEAISKFITIRETRYADLASANAAAKQDIDDQLVGLTGIGRDLKESQLVAAGMGRIEKVQEGVDKDKKPVYSYKISDKFSAIATKKYLGEGKETRSNNQLGNVPGDGGQQDTTLDDLLRKLKMTRDAGIDAEGGIGELNKIFKESGGDITKFTGVIQQLNDMGANREFLNFIEGLDNKTQAAYLNVKELEKGVVELTPVGEKAMKLFQEAGLGGFAADADTTITAIEMQTEGFIRLREAGVSVADSLEMMSDEQFMYDLQQAKSVELQDELIAKYYERMAAEQKLLEDTDPEKAFDAQMNKAMKYYDFLEKEAKAAAQPEIDRVNGLIDANEKLIDTKQRSIEMDYDRPIEKLNQDLAIINKAADGINKKYDEQEKALEKISSLNQEIAEQEKGRLTLADALTSGDISAAARAAQEMRATAATNAIQRSSSALQIARESEVSALTAGGLTRAQIEEKIYSLEQLRLPIIAQITALQDKNYNYSKNELEPLTEALNARIKNIDTARTAWENQQLAIQAAAFEADKTNAKFKIGEGIVAAIKKLWDDIKDKNITLSVNTVGTPLVTSTSTSGISTTGRGGGFFRIQDRMYGGKILPMAMGGMVPKYMVAGGGIGSDTVPAMLTPGEFVMNKKASQEFGPLLSMLNESKYPSMIGSSYDGKGSGGGGIATSVSDNSSNVYNYSVGITVPQSNANPNDIARAVIGQIKYIDNQRIRGQR